MKMGMFINNQICYIVMVSDNIDIESRIDTLNLCEFRKNIPSSIILHSTRGYPEFEDVLDCHKNKKKWSGMGYHLFISESGIISQGRPFDVEGAHTLGFNANSIGICIYSADGNLNKNKIDLGKSLINKISLNFGGLELLSHTQAQVRYNTQLLSNIGIESDFMDTPDVVSDEIFLSLKKEMDLISGYLSTDKNSHLKTVLKNFKNCPGELFYHFSGGKL
jgi:hypothetical protein